MPVKASRNAGKAVPYDNAEPAGDLRFTFESGDWQGWRVVQGKLPDALTNRRDLPNHKSLAFNKEGQHFLFTGNQQGKSARQRPTHRDHRVARVSAHRRPHPISRRWRQRQSTYVCLVDAAGKELRRAHGTNSPIMRRVDWDVGELKGQQLRMRIVDESQGGWGHVTFDDFSCAGELID